MASSANVQPANPQLMWNSDNVRDVAESVGISSLNPETIRALSQEVEYRLGQIITEAMRFMHMSKRTVLGTQDISQALVSLNVDPLFGYESTRPLRFGEASLGPGQPLFYIDDEEIDFEKLINAPLPKVPRDVSITSHWLAVSGVQPNIPQNPSPAEARTTDLVAKGPGANPALAAFAGTDNTTFKPKVKHVLSKELILFFDKVVAAIIDESKDPDVATHREAALSSVRTEPGLHNLIPYFINYIAEKVTHCMNNLHVLHQMMRLNEALLYNKSLYLDPHAVAMCPSIMTCLVGDKIGPKSLDPDVIREQYQIRQLAASLLGRIKREYGKTNNRLQYRLARSCFKIWTDVNRTLPQFYGATMGLRFIGGVDAVRDTMLAGMKNWDEIFERIRKRTPDGIDSTLNEIHMQRLLSALVGVIKDLQTASGPNTNGVYGDADDEEPALQDALGKMIGTEIAKLRDHDLNKIIFKAVQENREEKAREKRKRTASGAAATQ